ncbi:potassium channel family protein [Halomicrococcus sp. SG-WS-1]|uniref:potassium channel family protein n=1 Tax=Halomicrococcus sp. SG-WS-1 TaxID=3439057 RepID=UPI003F7914F4
MEHGSNPWRVIAVSAITILMYAAVYPLVGGIHDGANDRVIGYFDADVATDAPRWYLTGPFLRGLYFSVVTFTTLGFGDMQPLGGWARLLATTETILGSVLIALLVFVLSRTVTW